MPTPLIYAQDQATLFSELPDQYKDTRVELVYVTDRAPERDENGALGYGYRRSQSLAAGTTVVNLGSNVAWEDLVQASRTNARIREFDLSIESISEFVRLPEDPIPYTLVNNQPVPDPAIKAQLDQGIGRLESEMKRRLALTPRKDVYIYIHGFANKFEDAAFAMAELWHFLGREGVPVIYTWPAGHPGLTGYTYDRESSEFTVFHLKRTIKWIANQPNVENLHIIAHSRGTDVTLNAFRELVLAERAAGRDPRRSLKMKNLVLAAGDIDLQVLSQRVGAEYLALATEQSTLYTSPEDNAIGLAQRLFSSPRGRLGTFSIEDADETELERFDNFAGRVAVVNFDNRNSRGIGHSYFRTNPSVSSDLVLKLRYGLAPGDPGRPLVHLGSSFWEIPEGYPAQAPPQ